MSVSLNRANAILYKLRHFIDRETVAIFELHLHYFFPVWAQNSNSIKILLNLEEKSLPLIHCLIRFAHTSHLFKEASTLKLLNKIALENSLFILTKFNPQSINIGSLCQLNLMHMILTGTIYVLLYCPIRLNHIEETLYIWVAIIHGINLRQTFLSPKRSRKKLERIIKQFFIKKYNWLSCNWLFNT